MVTSTAPKSWGRAFRYEQTLETPFTPMAARARVQKAPRPVLPYGLGRSYGDVCLNENGVLLATERLDHFIAFDRETGCVTAESGVTLAEILTLCHQPNDDGTFWFLPVTPGTKFVTLGGALANDVHGKNHHNAGTFGCHVLGFDLARSDGTLRHCSPTENADLFNATIGGLGLTGLILRVRIQLKRVPGLRMDAEDIQTGNLQEFLALARDSDKNWDYTIAWLDCLAQGAHTGRGIFSRANHAAGDATNKPSPRLNLPIAPPITPLNRLTLSAFNATYWRKLGRVTRRRSLVSYEPFFYPLDAIGQWNLMYGRAGFYQFQCVIPWENAEGAVDDLLKIIARSGEGSFLAVLKTFGAQASPGLLSFPREGLTLALDFPNRGATTRALLARLESLTHAAKGRLYPAKDGLMSKAAFHQGYPKLSAFSPLVDPAFSSSYWRRVEGANA